MNLVGIDNVNSTSSLPFNYNFVDGDERIMIKERIEDQYIKLNNLGFDYLSEIDDQNIKNDIIKDIINYVNENYTAIMNFESLFTKDFEEMGKFIYNFFCIDCYNTILPNFINQIKCYSINDFEEYAKIKYTEDTFLFKNALIICIKSILEQVLKLSQIDKTIKKDDSYNKLIKKYSYYIDLIDFGPAEKILNNYIFPLLNKHFNQILWRSN